MNEHVSLNLTSVHINNALFYSRVGVLCGEALPEDDNEKEAIFESIKKHEFGLFMSDGAQFKGRGPAGIQRFIPIRSLERRSSSKLLVNVKRFARGFGLFH